jgi:predicted CoA-binding protein
VADPKEVLERYRVIAVVGASRSPEKEAGRIPRRMQEAGFRIIPVNPHADTLFGERVYRRLEEIPEQVEIVDVFRPSAEAADVARQAVAARAKAVWLQLGISSPEARAIAEGAGLDYVEDHCIAVERARYGIVKDP